VIGEEVPQELINMLDGLAGKKHSRNGRVVGALAMILTKYDELRERDSAQAHRIKSGEAPHNQAIEDPSAWPLDW